MKPKIAFKKVYEEFQSQIRHYLVRMVGPHEAEDVAQEVFAKVSRSLGSFKGEAKLNTWLYRIATNAALDRLRSSAFKHASEFVTLDEKTPMEDANARTGHRSPTTDQNLIRKEMSECVREFIDKIPPDYKTVLILSEIEGFKNREIADILQGSLETVKIRLHRARARLKKELDAGCSFYHDEQNILACDRKPPPPLFPKKSD